MTYKRKMVALLLVLPCATLALERVELLPPEAQSYLRVSNTSSVWKKLKESSFGKLWVDPQFQDFMENPEVDSWAELFYESEDNAEGEMILEQIKMLHGEAVLGFDLGNDTSYMIAAMSPADFARGLELDDKLQEIMEVPFGILKSTFLGVEMVQHIEYPGTLQEDDSWQTQVGTTFVMGPDREWVEHCIVRLKKEEVSEPEGHPTLNVNLPLSEIFSASFSGAGAIIEHAMLEALGLLTMENLSMTLELKEGELVLDSLLSVSDLGRGLFTLLDVDPAEFPAVSFIPENIASIEVGRFNLLRFWQEIPIFLASTQPAIKMQFDMLVAMIQQQAGIDLEQDLLTHIGTKYVAFSVVEDRCQTSVMAIDLKDSSAFKQGLETALNAPSMQPYVATGMEIVEFLDHTLYIFPPSAPGDTPGGICVAGDYLLYGQPDGLRQVIRNESNAGFNPAYERTELVQELRKNVSARAFTFSAIDWKKNMDVLVHELNQSEHMALLRQQWAKSGVAFPPPDFSKLPPADHMATFFNVSYQYTEANANGLHQRIILKY